MIKDSRLQDESADLTGIGKTCVRQSDVQPQSAATIESHSRLPAKMSTLSHETEITSQYAFAKQDEDLLDRLQADAFRYFAENADSRNGLIADSTKPGSAASIAATGFALSCYPLAVERGWLSRTQAVDITRRTLEFFIESRQSPDPTATGHKGFYYHFLDMKSGERALECELSTIDSALLLAGVLVASEYFDHKGAEERTIRSLGKDLLARADWAWTLDENGEINQSWTPDKGFHQADWEGYTEALIMYVLAAASTLHPLSPEVYERDAKGYEWHHNAGLDWIHAAPLFIHLFPQAWIDLRGLHDNHVGKHADIDYFENSRRAITVQRAYAQLNPFNYVGYGQDIWGLSACAGPDEEREKRNGQKQQFMGYAARGVTAGPDDGTLVPWAAAACLAHAPEAAMAGVRAMLDIYPRALRDGQFVGAINPSLPGQGPEGWVAPACFGIDQGLVVMMIENARTGLVWELTRNSAVVRKGLKKLGFGGGWLK